ncbi:Alpha/Beta hydrolase protein [Aspergillus unguis]
MSLETFAYGDHDLQTVTVARPLPGPAATGTPRSPSNNAGAGAGDGYWVILIHGGAWRDPTQTSTSYLLPALRIFSSASSTPNQHPSLPSSISGIASISYRLSAHPAHPQDLPATLPSRKQVAKHPDHLRDVQAAMEFLQREFGFGERYVLVGHSCGATLAFQAVMGSLSSSPPSGMNGMTNGEGAGKNVGEGFEYAKPLAILGMAGVYDLRLLRDSHTDISAYQEFIAGAFGDKEDVWDAVSPAVVTGPQGVEGWEAGKIVVLAHSKDDELCDLAQSDRMRGSLKRWEGESKREVHFLSIEGKHDEAWEKGEELARGILYTIEQLQKVGP